MDDLSNRRFGKLVVDSFYGRDKHRHQLWKCKCDCGKIRYVTKWNLLSGNTVSCGCYAAARAKKQLTKHGQYSSKYYSIWHDMMRCCYDPRTPFCHRYGGRGIVVCDEWKDITNFVSWCEAYNPPLKTTIDRKDNDGIYEPSNCSFVLLKENQNNRSSNRVLVMNGDAHTIAEWSEIIGLPYSVIYSRLNKLGWTIEKALTTPSRRVNHVSELS